QRHALRVEVHAPRSHAVAAAARAHERAVAGGLNDLDNTSSNLWSRALSERAFDRRRDLAALLDLVAVARASDARAFLHPGGLQWLLRRLGHGAFAVRQWFDEDALAGIVIEDSGYVIVQAVGGRG
ncbi:MAG: hypothetical protein HY553_16045, partial [Elusimicrobia bacterium]|nr:hypothetical protein [Elusimicrobiota bacterium]